MFDLRKDLKVYQSSKHSTIKALVEKGRTVGNNYVFDALIRLTSIKNSYGSEMAFEYVTNDIKPDMFKDFLRDIGASYLYSSNGYIQVSQANPKKSYSDFLTGTNGIVSVPSDRVQSFLEKNLPATRMNALVFNSDSRLREVLGKASGWSRRRSKEKKARMFFMVWALYGLEVAASSKRKEIDEAINQIQPTDFGIMNCDDMENLLTYLAGVDCFNVDAMIKAVNEIDNVVKRNGGKAIVRKKPRAKRMLDVFKVVTSYGVTTAA